MDIFFLIGMAEKDNFFESKEFKDNLNKYEEAGKNGQSVYLDSDDFADIAEYYYQNGRLEDANAVIEEALGMFPGAAALWIFKARMALQTEENVEKAYHCIDNIEDKSDWEYAFMLAEIMLFDNKQEEANVLLYDRLSELEDEEQDRFRRDVATVYTEYELFDKAKEWFEQISPDNDNEYKELRGRISMGNGNFEESENIFQELLEENPYSSHYWNNLASLQFLKNNFNDSITSSEFSIAINPDDSEAILNKANGLFGLGNYEEALTYYNKYSTLEPDDATGEMLKGVTQIHLSNPEKALVHFKKAEQMSTHASSNLREIYQEMAFTLSRLGYVEEALSYIEKKQHAKNDNYSETMLLKGHVLLEHDYLEMAQEAFQEAVRSSNNSPNTFLQIAISVYDCGYIHLAYKLLLSFFENVDDSCPDGYSYLAICAKELGKTEEFMEAVKQACQKNPTEARMVLADLFPTGMKTDEYYGYLLSINGNTSI